jgi:hypothetical protein
VSLGKDVAGVRGSIDPRQAEAADQENGGQTGRESGQHVPRPGAERGIAPASEYASHTLSLIVLNKNYEDQKNGADDENHEKNDADHTHKETPLPIETNNGKEGFRFQGSPAHERPVDVLHIHEIFDVFRLH